MLKVYPSVDNVRGGTTIRGCTGSYRGRARGPAKAWQGAQGGGSMKIINDSDEDLVLQVDEGASRVLLRPYERVSLRVDTSHLVRVLTGQPHAEHDEAKADGAKGC